MLDDRPPTWALFGLADAFRGLEVCHSELATEDAIHGKVAPGCAMRGHGHSWDVLKSSEIYSTVQTLCVGLQSGNQRVSTDCEQDISLAPLIALSVEQRASHSSPKLFTSGHRNERDGHLKYVKLT